jgi:hypothetical protein
MRTVSSTALFCYRFRYTCLLILAAETPHDHSEEVAEANQLAFLQVRATLRARPSDLNRLHESLERDFAILAYLLDQRNTVRFDPRFEDVMLTIHFRAMSAYFRLTRKILQEFANEAQMTVFPHGPRFTMKKAKATVLDLPAK